MPNFDFTRLSSQDFEELVRDLLQAEWGLPLEAFTGGRDGGIDLRYASADSGNTIIQCKHFAKSGFGKLLSHLRLSELQKIEQLKPNRYVVATSVGLTPANKDDIVSALSPYVLRVGDVLGADDIEGLLQRQPQVERRHFKLWLTSTRVLEQVLHNAEHCQTEFEVDRIRRKLPKFVQTAGFPRAMELLDKTRIVVISGVPGIGKTTLAEILLYTHLERGYQPVVIQSELIEGKKLFRSGAKQIFYFDDFLGQTFLGDRSEYLGRNQDVAVVDFMEMVAQSDNSLFILTTREHILRSALEISERLTQSPILKHHCVLELEDYSFGQKARILYNHLYFSDLPQPYKEAVLDGDFFLKVIRHEHFSPRVIEWLSSYDRLGKVSPDNYQAHVSALLEAPEKIWAHAFHHQISDAARNALLCFYTLGENVESQDLEPAFISLHRIRGEKYGMRLAPGDFHAALRELDGAFFSYDRGHISYLNPSVREFVGSTIYDDQETIEDLLRSAVRFRQLANIWRFFSKDSGDVLKRFLDANIDDFCDSVSKLLESPYLRWSTLPGQAPRGYFIDTNMEGRIRFLAEAAEAVRSIRLANLTIQAVDNLAKNWGQRWVDFHSALGVLENLGANTWILSQGGLTVYRGILDLVLDELSTAGASDWLGLLSLPNKAINWTEDDGTKLSMGFNQYIQYEVDNEIHNCTTLDEMDDLKESLSLLSEEFGLDFSENIEWLDEEISYRDRPDDDEGWAGVPRDSREMPSDEVTEDDVRQMFATLRLED